MTIWAIFLFLNILSAWSVSLLDVPSEGGGVVDYSWIAEAIESDEPLRIVGVATLELAPLEQSAEIIREEPFTVTIDLLKDRRCIYRVEGYDFHIDESEIIATRRGVDDAYVRVPVRGGPAECMRRLLGAEWYPMLHFIYPDCSTQEDGGFFRKLLCAGQSSPVSDAESRSAGMIWRSGTTVFTLDVDPETGRPTTATLVRYEGEDIPEGTRLIVTWKWDYQQIPEDADHWFQRGNRFRVDRISSLRKLDEGSIPMVGRPAPSLKLPDLAGEIVDLANLRGRVLVIDFWATWCGPCRQALPKLQSLADEMSDSPVTILAVNCYEQKKGEAMEEAVKSVVKSLSLKLPVLLDVDGAAARSWGVKGLPSTFVVDEKGQIVSVHVGAGPEYLQDIRDDVIEAIGD
ncbi:MAG: hypothetical protein CMJ40_00995 [Phycisphaerae bacterium]|nr:hypothetical protein [Phycisphaerae bacterium]